MAFAAPRPAAGARRQVLGTRAGATGAATKDSRFHVPGDWVCPRV